MNIYIYTYIISYIRFLYTYIYIYTYIHQIRIPSIRTPFRKCALIHHRGAEIGRAQRVEKASSRFPREWWG